MVAHNNEDWLPVLLMSCVAVMVVATACMIRYLPEEFAAIIVSWAMVSLSVGISFGHCVLSER